MLERVCGRYVSTTPPDVLAAQFGVDEVVVGADSDRPRWNVAPTDPVPAVSETAEGVRRLGTLRWGLLPSFVTDPSSASKRINARAETVATSPAFRGAFIRRRCILPADGFYEWDKDKQPWFITRADGRPLAMAGLWESWHGPDNLVIRTCAVITTSANPFVSPVHDRMPAILEPVAYEAWLDRSRPAGPDLVDLLRPAADDLLVRYPVTKRVNSVRNDGPELLEPGSIDRQVPLTLL
jgi:putative SOS response-associated peptidase YedK